VGGVLRAVELVDDRIHGGSQAGGLDLRTCGRDPQRRADS